VHYWRKSKEIEGNIFLTLETLNPTFWYFLSVSGYEYYYSIEKELQHQWLVLFFVVGIRNVIFNYGIHSKENNRECKKQYQLI
jgi:hypothetical protein